MCILMYCPCVCPAGLGCAEPVGSDPCVPHTSCGCASERSQQLTERVLRYQLPGGPTDTGSCRILAVVVFLLTRQLHVCSGSLCISTSVGHMDARRAGDLSTLFDVGGIFGGILAGVISDKSHKRATTCGIMLLCAAPTLYIFSAVSKTGPVVTVCEFHRRDAPYCCVDKPNTPSVFLFTAVSLFHRTLCVRFFSLFVSISLFFISHS
ncbi:hypothetical protein FKM82_028001 [Ascaphus truei]